MTMMRSVRGGRAHRTPDRVTLAHMGAPRGTPWFVLMTLVVPLMAGCHVVFGLVRENDLDGGTDAAMFDPGQCPPTYPLRPLLFRSAYRIVQQSLSAQAQRRDCENDEPGFTHLAAIGSVEEAIYLEGALEDQDVQPGAWIGAVQVRSASSPSAGWIIPDGTLLPAGLWGSLEPNDGFDGTVEGGNEQYTRLDRGRQYLVDIAPIIDSAAICECDGVAVSTDFSKEFDAQQP